MSTFYNRTRISRSIPQKLLRHGRLLELPLYYLLRSSDLAREGLENSGSYLFADHIYRNLPSGCGAFGCWLDARLLAMPAVRSFRNRYVAASSELLAFLQQRASSELDILSAPSGIPRELMDAAQRFRASGGSLTNVRFHVLDLDPGVLSRAQLVACEHGIDLHVHCGDAFDADAYGGQFDYITCTGFGEFLDDLQLLQLFSLFHGLLRPGTTFFTSAMRRLRLSDYLLRLAELNVHYRSGADLAMAVASVGFQSSETWTDEHGIQCFLRARK
ncbi:MAG TPA: class I SAM-dependent methyltransferase [Terriglobales bacterium]|nr:class I SAM-dependent methyltransferase [Terriglobales bacterium]